MLSARGEEENAPDFEGARLFWRTTSPLPGPSRCPESGLGSESRSGSEHADCPVRQSVSRAPAPATSSSPPRYWAAARLRLAYLLGPVPSAADDGRVDRLLTEFNQKRNGSTAEAVVATLRAPLAAHYAGLIDRGWPLLWQSLERERRWPEAPSVERRWTEDVEAYERHLEWVTQKDGGYRTRQTNAQAVRTLRTWEEAQRLELAEEAIDDPLRMIPYLLTDEAVVGEIASVDLNHVEPGLKRAVRRPLFELETEDRCRIPTGKALFWTRTPRAPAYTVVGIRAGGRRGGSIVTLMHETSAGQWERPFVGQEVIFSAHHVHSAPLLMLPATAPWTHSPKVEPELSIDSADDEGSGG
jgi:hypothetical protein